MGTCNIRRETLRKVFIMDKSKPKYSCPIHGPNYIKKEGSSYYCAFPTPNERFSKCFYHPTGNSHAIPKEDIDKEKPDVMKALFTNEIDARRINRQKNLQRMRMIRSSRSNFA